MFEISLSFQVSNIKVYSSFSRLHKLSLHLLSLLTMSSDQIAAAAEINALPPPAPTPPVDTGSKPTDSQGTRKVDSEDIKSHGLDPAKAKKRGKTAPRFASHTAVSQAPPVNDLRHICNLLPYRPVRHAGPNFFIPCFAMLYNLLATMNDKVCTLRPFGENGTVNDWIPQVSVIVYSVLAYVQILRTAQLTKMNSAENQLFLDNFLCHFPLEYIEIPGPLVPFFRSISVCSPGFGNYQDVSPVLPRFTFAEQHLFNIDYAPPGSAIVFQDITMMLPNIPLMYDQFVHLIKYLIGHSADTPHLYSTYTPLRRIFNQPAPAANDPIRAHFHRQLRSIGFWNRPTASNGLMARFAAYVANQSHCFPAPWAYDSTHAAVAAQPDAVPPVEAVAANWTVYEGIHEWMMMTENANWFSIFLRGMHNFTRHWKGNQSLLSISPLTSTASLILYRHVTVDQIAQESIFGGNSLSRATHRLTNNTSAHTTCPYICEEDFEDSQIAQINVACDTASADARRIGDVGVTRFGPFWDVAPDVSETSRGDLTPELQNMIASLRFFVE